MKIRKKEEEKIRTKKGWGMRRCSGIMAAVLLFMAAGCGNGESLIVSQISTKQLLRVDKETCSLPEAKVYLLNYQNLYGTVYGVDLWENGEQDGSLEDYIKKLTISQLVKILSMDSLAKSLEIALDDTELVSVERAAKAYYDSLNSAERTYLEVDTSAIRKLYEDYALAQKVYASLTAEINNEVSDDEARIMEAMQIYVTSRETAEEIGNALSGGGDFTSLANSYNEAGEVTIQFGRGELPKEVEKVAFSLNNEETSACIEAGNGYYFLHCINKFNEELTDANKVKIVQQREKEAFGDVYDAYSRTLSKKLYQDIWDDVSVHISEEMTSDSFFAIYQEYFGGTD